MRNLATTIWRGASDVLFPHRCAACEAALPEASSGDYCDACHAELALIAGAVCERCSAPLAEETLTRDRCVRCRKLSLRFDNAIAVGVYEGLFRSQVLAAKHTSGEGAAAALGRMMADLAAQRLEVKAVDVVASIPMHWRRRVIRQHNSAESMGDQFARRLGITFEPRLLRWKRATRKQSELSASRRVENVRGALSVRAGYRIQGATVVLVDDILTTGATCSDAARALKAAGAARVVGVVAARSL